VKRGWQLYEPSERSLSRTLVDKAISSPQTRLTNRRIDHSHGDSRHFEV
jgi:hypothetical protein